MKSHNRNFIFPSAFFLTGAVTGCAAFLYGRETMEIIRNVITALIGMGAVLFLVAVAESERDLTESNENRNQLLFFAIFIICLLLAVVFPLIPAVEWPYIAVFIALGLFSDELTGLVSGSLLVMITLLTGNLNTTGDFFMHFICGVIGIILFRKLDDSFKVGGRVFVSLLMLFICLSANYTLLCNEIFPVQLFLMPVINVFISLVLLLIVLKCFSKTVIHRYREKYQDLNDQIYPLLVSLKEKDKDEYFHAVHTAYLCDRISRKLGMDDALVKAGGYYHHIGKLNGGNTWENIEKICIEYKFPPNLRTLLMEYNKSSKQIVSKEGAVLLFSDAIIDTIWKLLQKDADIILDYHLIIDTVFKRKIGSGILDSSKISMDEINRMKKMFLEEKLYYDFLR